MLTSSLPVMFSLLAWAAHNWHVLYWGGWIVAFLLVEIPAVCNAKLGDTFSETWWRWLRIGHGDRVMNRGELQVLKRFPLWVAIPLRLLIVAFGVWLIGHLGFGLWGGN